MLKMSRSFIVNDIKHLNEIILHFVSCIELKDVITFSGEVGVGKTTFIKLLIEKMIDEKIEVSSPTFNLLNIYKSANIEVWHYDLYRLIDVEEIYELGIEEAFEKSLVLIEWPGLINNLLPINRLDIDIQMVKDKPDQRIFNLIAYGNWCKRLQNFLESISI